jgi:hypothetical protein
MMEEKMMRKFVTFALLLLFLAAVNVDATPVSVQNHSFETGNGGVPYVVKTIPADPDFWSWGTGAGGGANGQDGIEAPSSDGDVCAAVNGVDSVFQLTSHVVAEGDIYTLQFDAYYLWASAWNGTPYDATIQGRLYYDDGGTRTVIDYIEDNLTDAYVWHYDYTLPTNIGAGNPAIGNQLGIELSVVQDPYLSWFGFDNVRLDVVPEPVSMALLGIGGLALLRRRSR